MHQEIIARFNSLKEKQLSIDITRGKPDTNQLDLSNKLLNLSVPLVSENGIDLRNYGEPFGIIEARRLGSELLNTHRSIQTYLKMQLREQQNQPYPIQI